MKKSWPHVIAYAKKLKDRYVLMYDWDRLNEFGKMARFNDAFLRHHANASLIHFDKDRRLLGATYLTIDGVNAQTNHPFRVDGEPA